MGRIEVKAIDGMSAVSVAGGRGYVEITCSATLPHSTSAVMVTLGLSLERVEALQRAISEAYEEAAARAGELPP